MNPDTGEMMAATYETAPTFRRVALNSLFVMQPDFRNVPSGVGDIYDVTSDDQRFLMARRFTETDGEEVPRRVVVFQNFFEELRSRTAN